MPGDLDSPARLARLGRLTNDPKNAAARIFVGNTTPSNSLDIDLRDIFSRFGEIIGVSVHKQGTYAFVQFTAEEEAQAAIRGAGELSLAGKRIDVRIAVDKKNAGASGGTSYASQPPQPRDRRPPYAGGSGYHPESSSSGSGSQKLSRSHFRLFDVGQSRPSSQAASAAPGAPSSGSRSAPDYSGAPGSRYAMPTPSEPSGASSAAAAAAAIVEPGQHPVESREVSGLPPPEHRHARSPVPGPRPISPRRSRSPHHPGVRPPSPERHRGRSRSPGWYRYQEERKRYEYELARWEDEERYRRWYYEHYGASRHSERDRHERHYRDHHERGREHERHGSRYDEYRRRQEDERHPDFYRDMERERRHAPDHYHPHHQPERYPAEHDPRPLPHHMHEAPRNDHYGLFDQEHRAAPAPPRPQAQPPKPQKPPLDSLVLMIHKQQQGYANLISHRLKEAGMLSETREMPASASLPDIITAGIKRKLLFLFLVTSDNELHRSLSVHILHTSPVQEHKNMPFDDALGLVKSNFEEYCADIRAGRLPSRLAPVHSSSAAPSSAPQAPGKPNEVPPRVLDTNNVSQLLAHANTDDISQEQLTSLITSLREKQQAMEQEKGGRGAPGENPTDSGEVPHGPSQDPVPEGERTFNWSG